MGINIGLPEQSRLRPKIMIFGVGGAGGNAVNNMIQADLRGVDFFVANTDAQALDMSLAEHKIRLGINCTKGLGAGSLPEVGKVAAEESIDEIKDAIADCNMLFIAAGMGGGTGTGAAPVIAKLAKEMGILTVGIVTKPFLFEGFHRMRVAELGIERLRECVDTSIVIPNQNLFRITNEKTTLVDAFKLADSFLHRGVRGITDLMVEPGLINLDFADIRVVMSEMGKAMIGTGEAEGEDRALRAAEAAIHHPLLDNMSIKGARGLLVNITGGDDLMLFEVDAAAERIREEAQDSEDGGCTDTNIIFGSTFNEKMTGKISVSVLATGIDRDSDSSSSFSNSATTNVKPSEVQKKAVYFQYSGATIDTNASEITSSGRSGAVQYEQHNNPPHGVHASSASSVMPPSPAASQIVRDEVPETVPSSGHGGSWKQELDFPAFLRRKKS